MNWSRVLRPVWSLTALALALSLLAVPMGARAQDDDDDDDDSPRQGTVRIYERNDRNDRDERIERNVRGEGGYLGVQVQDVTRTLQRARNLPTDEGALVSRVEQDSPADRNGVRRGDVIVEVDGEKIDDSKDLIRVVRGIDPGKNSRITLWRAGSLRTVNVQLGDRPQGRPTPPTPPDMGRWPMPGGDDEDRVIQLPPSNDERDQLRQQIRELRAQVDRLREEIRAMRSEMRSHDNDDDDDDRGRNDRDD